MNEESNKQVQNDSGAVTRSKPTRSRALPIIIAAIAVISIAGGAIWFFWPGRAGKPVPAPRSVSFDESANQPNAITGDQKLVLSPEQAQGAGLKVETVGERPTSEAAGEMATG